MVEKRGKKGSRRKPLVYQVKSKERKRSCGFGGKCSSKRGATSPQKRATTAGETQMYVCVQPLLSACTTGTTFLYLHLLLTSTHTHSVAIKMPKKREESSLEKSYHMKYSHYQWIFWFQKVQ